MDSGTQGIGSSRATGTQRLSHSLRNNCITGGHLSKRLLDLCCDLL